MDENALLMSEENGRLVRDDRKATVTQINHSLQPKVCRIPSLNANTSNPEADGYSSRRPHRVPLLSAKNRKRRLQFAQAHQNWTIEDWKNVAWSDESRFLLRYSDGRVRIWRKEHERMDPSYLCLNGSGWWWWFCNDVGDIFLGPLVPIEHRFKTLLTMSIPL